MNTLDEWLTNLRKTDELIIVEGKKDKQMLESLGIKNIVSICGKPLYKFIDGLVEKKIKQCIILVDLDKEGKKLYSKIKSNLQRYGIKINNKFREFLYKNTKLTQIEGIESYLNNLR